MVQLVSKATVGEELTKFFPAIEQNAYFDDFCRIGSFLSDKDEVLRVLREKLEPALRDLITVDESELESPEMKTPYRLLLAEEYFSREASSPSGNPALKHLLRRALSRLQTAHGFAPDAGKPRILTRQLDEGEFRGLVKSGATFKDPGVGAVHGEYTHQIQWYAVAESAILANPARSVYQETAKLVVTTDTGKKGDVWQCLVDRDPNGIAGLLFKSTDLRDFRCPEFLNSWIVNNASDDPETGIPVLKWCLGARMKKRAAQQLGKPENMFDYLARKMYPGKPLKPGDGSSESNIVEQVLKGGFYDR